jgi:hypothetical protein
MSFVNVVLQRLLGSGIPHLLLDQLALRFELSAYQRLFARAATVWSAWPKASPGVTSSKRLRHLIRMRSELNEFVTALANSMTLIEARAHMATHAGGAELALLTEA